MKNLPPRLELFSDAVFAIIITIMVLELHPPEGSSLKDLGYIFPIFMSYVLSFIYIIIYWNNHHHLMRTVKHPTASIMWANSHLLFWLSLFPFSTAWVGKSGFAFGPTIIYGLVMFCAATAYFILQKSIIQSTGGTESPLAKLLGKDTKGKLSTLLYAGALGVTFIHPNLAYIFFVIVATMWIIPDKRIEKAALHE